MATECYYGDCRFHGSQESPPEEGPFCYERECRATEQEIRLFEVERAAQRITGMTPGERLRKDTAYHGHCNNCGALHPQHHANCVAILKGED